jgi:hypothetical protein
MYDWKQRSIESPSTSRRVIFQRRSGNRIIISEGWYARSIQCWFNEYGHTVNPVRVIAWADIPAKGWIVGVRGSGREFLNTM